MKKPVVESYSANTQTNIGMPDSLSLLSIWRILWDRKWTIGIVAFVFAVTGFFLASGGERTYTAESLLVLEENNAALSISSSGGGTVSGDPSQAVQVFGSRRVIGRVVDDLDLLSDPEFNSFLDQGSEEQTPSLLQRVIGFVAGGGPGSASNEDAVDEEPQPVSEDFIRQSTVRAVQARVRFVSDPRTSIIQVVAQTQNPERSAELANEVARAFLQDLLDTRFASLERVAEQLSGRVAELRQNVRERESALQAFVNSTDDLDRESLTELNDEAQGIRPRVDRLNQQQEDTRLLLEQLQQIETLPVQEQQAQIADIPVLAELAGRLPSEDLVASLRDELQQQLARDQRLVMGLQSTLDELEARIAQASEHQLRFQQLEREATAATEIYEFSVRRLNELRVQGGVESGGGRIVFEAEVPQLPDGRGRVRTAFLFGLLGLVTIVMWVLVREASNQTIRTASDLQHIFQGARVVGMPRAPRGWFFDRKARQQRFLLSSDLTDYSEAVRRLRSSLMTEPTDRDSSVILATSDFVTAGRSLLTLGLARSFALLGKRVLVIGADLRDMTLSEQLGGTTSKVTLQDVLSDRQKLEDGSLLHSDMDVHILLPGLQVGSPADMLESADFRSLIDLARAEFQVVIVDAPPLLAAPDASLVSKYTDQVVLVAAAEASTAESVIAAVEQLPNGLGDDDVTVLYAAKPSKDTQVRARNSKFARI